ncbi:MAG: ABC transporter permease [Rhizobiales bacterium 65-79]|jgi:NitT/TauT family transport system permease protein|nr:ABC transporter permease [Hyphomicrobiales bacterium]OJU01434.1 MAG: ABC transporter permease [Rhizobiales bacterium 65-79]
MDDVRTVPNTSRRFVDILHERPEVILSILLFIVLIGGWELVVRVFDVPKIIVPAPSAVIVSLIDGLRSPNFLYHFWVTFFETMVGFGLGASIGLLLGGIIGQFPLLERTLYPYVVAFQTIPKVAVAPIIVIWFGYGISSKVVITATIAFFPVLANTIVGLRATPLDQLELLVAYTANRWQTFWKVKVPQALPYIFVGLDVAIVLAVIGAIVGEFVGAQAGLGYLIMQRNFSMDMAGTFAILVVLSIMGMALHGIMQMIQRRIVFWMEPAEDRVMGA